MLASANTYIDTLTSCKQDMKNMILVLGMIFLVLLALMMLLLQLILVLVLTSMLMLMLFPCTSSKGEKLGSQPFDSSLLISLSAKVEQSYYDINTYINAVAGL